MQWAEAVLSSDTMELTTIPVTVEGTIFGGSKEVPVHTEIQYADHMLIDADNTQYDPAIASLSALLCADSYYREKDLAIPVEEAERLYLAIRNG